MDLSKIPVGNNPPYDVNALIEIPQGGEPVKYELDKASGLLRIDRPQRFSSQCPTLYGFVPRTYCGAEVGARCAERTGRTGIVGDGSSVRLAMKSPGTVYSWPLSSEK